MAPAKAKTRWDVNMRADSTKVLWLLCAWRRLLLWHLSWQSKVKHERCGALLRWRIELSDHTDMASPHAAFCAAGDCLLCFTLCALLCQGCAGSHALL
jgi:hypothetical protein